MEYLDKYCKLDNLIPMCKRTRPNTPIFALNTCEAEIIKKKKKHNHCERIFFKIISITYISLTASEKYIVILQQETTHKLDINSNTHTTRIIDSAHLIETNTDCIIKIQLNDKKLVQDNQI